MFFRHKFFLALLGLLLLIAVGPNILYADQRPNFLIIVSDDQPSGTLGEFMPQTQSRIFDAGVQFSRAYITTPSCCPSRSSIFTGMYASKHGVLVNKDLLDKPTFIKTLQKAGYETGLVGKYLNSWRGDKRSEFDYWVSFPGGSSTYDNPLLNVQGDWQEHSGYMTYLLEQYAVSFLDTAVQSDKPFLLFFTPNAPHDPFTPPEEDIGRWQQALLHRPPSFNEANKQRKPRWVRHPATLNAEWIHKIDTRRERQLEMLWSLDKSVGALLSRLEAAGKLDSTVVMYISDNGQFWGEHGILPGKDAPYEEATRVPFAIRYPSLANGPQVFDHLVANIDIAPTVLSLAGLPVPDQMDGVPLGPLVRGEIAPRPALLLEGFRNDEARKPFVAAVTETYKYIENFEDVRELYKLDEDPFELNNVYKLRAAKDLRKKAQARIKELLKQVGRPRRLNGKTARSRKRRSPNESAQVKTLEQLENHPSNG